MCSGGYGREGHICNAGADGGSSSRKISDLVRFTGGHQHSDGDAADEIYDFFNNDEKDSTLLAVLYDTSMSADETMDAIEELRGVVKDQCYISGMSAVVTDIKNLSNKETPVYVLIAVVLAVIVLSLTMDSALAPIFFLLSIGMAIVYNLGTNVFKGEISYVTQALAAVLQLGVTMDYSIFLWHSYEEQQGRFQGDKKRAMAHAISNTITSVVGSSITTVAGFVALCFMSFTLGYGSWNCHGKGCCSRRYLLRYGAAVAAACI